MNAPVCGMQLSESRHTNCHMGVVDRFVVRDQPLPDAEYYCYHCSLPGLFTRDFASIPAAPGVLAAARSDRKICAAVGNRPAAQSRDRLVGAASPSSATRKQPNRCCASSKVLPCQGSNSSVCRKARPNENTQSKPE
jgi:hypothetical protein